ncbi:hypothetical protein GCM10010156_70110 [Planobispora rosea]|uniref:Tetracycline repressor TetR C-terminal domain-containing protein n=2 Tax=Planobispora rosea TaxID=35762 RepID=A0A8J3S4W2_PLARO|nr:hypothetical protein GCM10010156_70110 [Planobispora rosea]GIH88436.1 hypothetical protein Pro02_68440 [Planobispora rosea]
MEGKSPPVQVVRSRRGSFRRSGVRTGGVQARLQFGGGREVGGQRLAVGRPLPSADAGWRAGLHDLAASGLTAFRAHPWLLQVVTSRTVFGPNVLARHDAALALLDGYGLAAADIVGCVAAVEAYTRGAASAVVEAEQVPALTGGDDEWWEQRAPLLGERMAGRFPRLTALEEAGALAVSDSALPYTLQRALDRFAFGLGLVLDSVGARITAARG